MLTKYSNNLQLQYNSGVSISLRHGSISLESDVSSTGLEYFSESIFTMGKGNCYQGRGGGRRHPYQKRLLWQFQCCPDNSNEDASGHYEGPQDGVLHLRKLEGHSRVRVNKNDSQLIRFDTGIVRFRVSIASDG